MDAVTDAPDRSAAYVEMQLAVSTIAASFIVAASQVVDAQWETLGARPAQQPAAGTIIDPEALLLLSAWLFPRQPALRDTVHDWVARWSDLLSVQRTRNIARAFPVSVQPELRAIAVTAHERGKDFRWSPVIQGSGARTRNTDVLDVEALRPADASLPTGVSRLAVEREALLLLRFRMAFGVGARADALAYLLARGGTWSTVTEIAQATGYTPSAIRRALDRMADAQIVLTVNDGATRYRCDASPWSMLLDLQNTITPWSYALQHFAFLATFVEWAEAVAKRKLTAYAIGEQLREIARNFRPTDDRDGLRAWEAAFRDGSTMREMLQALQTIVVPLHSEAATLGI